MKGKTKKIEFSIKIIGEALGELKVIIKSLDVNFVFALIV
jgi:hypothetical protein